MFVNKKPSQFDPSIPIDKTNDIIPRSYYISPGLYGDAMTSIDELQAEIVPLTTKGDIVGYGTEVDRLPVGTNGQTLVADSGEALGIKWATIAVPSYTASLGVQLVGNDFRFDPTYSPSFVNMTLSGVAGAATITGPATTLAIIGSQTLSLNSGTGQLALTANSGTGQIVLNGVTTCLNQLYVSDSPLYIGSPGNELLKIDWDNPASGMIIDSLDGIGGSSPLWMNGTGGKIGVNIAVGTALQSQLSVNGDIFSTYISTPANPTSGGKTYWKSDKNYYALNADGTETSLTGTGSGSNWFKFSPSIGLWSLRAFDWNHPTDQVSGIRIDNNGGSAYHDIQVNAATKHLRATNQNGVVRSLTGTNTYATGDLNYTNLGSDDLIYVNNFVDPIIITIDQTKLFKPLTIKLANGSTKQVTIQAAGGQTIDGFSQTLIFPAGGNAYGSVTLCAYEGTTDISIVSGCTGKTGSTGYNIDFAKIQGADVWVLSADFTAINGNSSQQQVINLPYTFLATNSNVEVSVYEGTTNVPANVKVVSFNTGQVTVEVYNPTGTTIAAGLKVFVRCRGL